jgi:GNAT superfamily N-acetyltransferase
LSLSVREALPEEYEEVAQVIRSANEEFAAALGDEWPAYREDLTDIARRAAKGTVLVGHVDGRLAGTVTYYPPRKPSAREDWWWWPLDVAYLRALAVLPSARRRGLGRALTLAAVELARTDHAAGVALNTTAMQPAAAALYEDTGFHRTGVITSWGDIEFLSYVLEIDNSLAGTLIGSDT